MNKEIKINNFLIIILMVSCFTLGFKIDYLMAQDVTAETSTQDSESFVDSKSLEIWQELPFEKRQALREKYKKFKSLPEEERQRIKNNLLKYKKLSPEQKEKIKNNLKKIKNLSPKERRNLSTKHKRWQGLSDKEKKSILSKYEKLKQMTPEKRKQLLEKRDRWGDLSQEKRRELKDSYFKNDRSARDRRGDRETFQRGRKKEGGVSRRPQRVNRRRR